MANYKRITGQDFKLMIAGAYQEFSRQHENINQLNVFPVPDGDTGTNMLKTLGAAARAVAGSGETGIGALSAAAAKNALMGARGNSGVILSQIFRGLARGLEGKKEADSAELGKAFQYGVLYAYRAVTKPVEGTILTVAKGIAKGAHHAVRSKLSIMEILQAAVTAGNRELAKTPELLPALKAAGVVDAGGKGLIVFLEGCLLGLGGQAEMPPPDAIGKTSLLKEAAPEEAFDLARPYCTEFMIKHAGIQVNRARKILQDLGDSLIVADGGDVLKVHVHTDNPGAVLSQAIGWGSLHDIKIDNMADQHRSLLIEEPPGEPDLELAVVSVAAGNGLADLMKQLGASVIIAGGQSMNPSVEEFVEAVRLNIARHYIVLPNNSNIVLAAAQVKKMFPGRIDIIPTVNAPQGLAALLAFRPEDSCEENVKRMAKSMENVKEAAITQAVRDSRVDGLTVKEGEFLGIIGGKVRFHGQELYGVLLETAQAISGTECEVISLYYGAAFTAAQTEAYAGRLAEDLPHLETEVYDGGQPYYHLIISVE